jgi:hypothetical protein
VVVHPSNKGAHTVKHAFLLTSLPGLEAFVNIQIVRHGPPLVNMLINLRTVNVELAARTGVGLSGWATANKGTGVSNTNK